MAMDRQRTEIIKDLSQDLRVIPKPGQIVSTVLAWLLLNTVIAVGITFMTGPFREGVIVQAQTHPQFLLESLVGVIAIVIMSVVAIRSGIPSQRPILRSGLLALSMLAIWIGFYVVGLWSPAVPESMLGKREIYCNVTALLTGIPSMIIGLVYIRRLWPLHGAFSGLLIGLAAGATPALIMQFACMYSVEHIFQHHILPGLALGPVGMIIGKFYLRTKPIG